jgi:RNA polymerase sigma factor (sigma-70 family)
MNQRRADFELLRSFARAGDQQALSDVIRRHLDLVYATALRKVGDAGAAEEIAQNVFIVLSRKAWRFAPDDSLPAWLYRTTLLESQSWLRGELRRRRREQTAAELGTTMKTPDEQYAFHALVPLLDEALLSLREKDRTALLLRFYDSHSLREVGAALGVGEDAAQKRVASAVEKLAQFFQRRGFKTATVAVTLTALRMTTASASAATFSSVTRVALRTAPPTLAGVLALLAWFAGLTRLQKATAFLISVTLVTIWLWNGKAKVEQAKAPEQIAQTAAVKRRTRNQNSGDRFFQSGYATPSVEENREVPPSQHYVEVSTEIESYSYKNGIIDRDLAFHRTIHAACITSTNRDWRIDADLSDSEVKCFFDGTNVYSSLNGINRITTPIGAGPMRIKPFDNMQPHPPTVSIHPVSNGRPWGGEPVNIPWLAFCSGNYLKQPGRVVPLPVFYILHAAGANGCSDRTETFDDELGLPKTVDLFTSSALYRSSVLEWNRINLLHLPTNSSLPDGLLKFHYAVTASTNYLGWNFPISFEYTEYEDDSKRPGVLVPVYGGVGKLTSIRFSAKPQNPCAPGFNHTVVDFRIHNDTNVQAIIYTSTNTSAMPTNSPDLQDRLARLAASLSSQGTNH